MRSVRASYTIARSRRFRGATWAEGAAPCVAIIDTGDHSKQPTLTNDMEAVVRDLIRRDELHPGDLLIYRDSDGVWDGVDWIHVPKGGNVEYVALVCEDVEEALHNMRYWANGMRRVTVTP